MVTGIIYSGQYKTSDLLVPILALALWLFSSKSGNANQFAKKKS